MVILKIYAADSEIGKQNFTGNLRNNTVLTFNDCWFNNAFITDCVFDHAYFYNCDLRGAIFKRSSFKRATFDRIITSMTSFWDCDLSDLYVTNFSFNLCSFYNCDFSDSYLISANFTDCTFTNCTFEGAELPPFFNPRTMEDCINVPYMPMACPEEGEFIGYKIASSEQMPVIYSLAMPHKNMGPADVLVTLKIPADAKRSSAGGRKCRCDKAEVIGLEFFGRHEGKSVAYSKFDARFEYRVGDEISVLWFDENRWNECASGIHFFINRKEALQYYGVMEAYYGSK